MSSYNNGKKKHKNVSIYILFNDLLIMISVNLI